uniref:C-type lectin domain-containing protein n=1 Tax=Plectus sambesii TaxID=2011161 RepID=A0A914XEW0_9BILA
MLDYATKTSILRAIFVIGGILALAALGAFVLAVVWGPSKFRQCPNMGLLFAALLAYLFVLSGFINGTNSIYLSTMSRPDCVPATTVKPIPGKTLDNLYLPSSSPSDNAFCKEYVAIKQNNPVVDALQLACEKQKQAIYANGSCYILHPKTTYFQAKISCRDLPGYYGHITRLTNENDRNLTDTLMTAANVSEVWVGVEYLPDPLNSKISHWYYTSIMQLDIAAEKLLWAEGYPVVYGWATYTQNIGLMDRPSAHPVSFICQYDKESEHEVSQLELYCLNISHITAVYYDGSCYYFNGGDIYNRTGCQAVEPFAANLAHSDTDIKWIITKTQLEANCESQTIGHTCSLFWQGMERISSCSNIASCVEQPRNSWFWVTSEGYKFPANQSIASHYWYYGEPAARDNDNDVAINCYLGTENININRAFQYNCQYRQKNNITKYQHNCLLSSNPSAYGYSSCFTLVRHATYFLAAKSQCTEFANGFLARVATVELARFLHVNLWSSHGIPSDMLLYTALSKQWLYANFNGTNTNVSDDWQHANNNTQIYEKCATLDVYGQVIITDCTKNRWFICQYPDPEGYKNDCSTPLTMEELVYWHP